MSPAENKALIRRFVEEAINKGNVAACDEFVALDFVELDPLPGQEQGREGLKKVLAKMLNAFPNMQWTVEEQIAEGDKVVSRFVWRGTHQAEFFGVPPTGRRVTVPGVVIDRIAAGKMKESRILMDTLSLSQQLGVVPLPGQARA
jgi:steroid delta-isomerase-like uncharacterized protein